MKRILSIILSLVLVLTIFSADGLLKKNEVQARSELRGIWIGYPDFNGLGLCDKSEYVFRENTKNILKTAKYYGTNTVYFHVRAFDDASWISPTFKPSRFLTSKSKFTYDPLQIFIEETHKLNMELHAWMNPYRITHNTYYNPAKAASTTRITTAINEVLKYDVDGIHFDDYFYHAKKYYKDPLTGSNIKASSKPSAAKRRANCNVMIKAAYSTTHAKPGVIFGISPAGNVENCMSGGADVVEWLQNTGYIDYIAPQIYWTDNWGSDGKTKMFSNRLAQWKALNINRTNMYIGLALYRTGQKSPDDKGWAKRNTNIRTQVGKLRNAGMNGYIIFSSMDLYDKHASKERYKLKGLVKPIKAKSIKFPKKKVVIRLKTKPTFKVKFTPTDTNPKTVKYKSSNTKIATVNSKGKITPKKKGKVTITAKTPNGKTAKLKVTIKKAKK